MRHFSRKIKKGAMVFDIYSFSIFLEIKRRVESFWRTLKLRTQEVVKNSSLPLEDFANVESEVFSLPFFFVFFLLDLAIKYDENMLVWMMYFASQIVDLIEWVIWLKYIDKLFCMIFIDVYLWDSCYVMTWLVLGYSLYWLMYDETWIT